MNREYWLEQVERIMPLLSEKYLRCVYQLALSFVKVADYD